MINILLEVDHRLQVQLSQTEKTKSLSVSKKTKRPTSLPVWLSRHDDYWPFDKHFVPTILMGCELDPKRNLYGSMA